MDEKFLRKLLLPGDLLLYDRNGLFNKLIKFKRGEKYSHVEVYIGNSKTVGSRNGEGVARYDLRFDGLAAVYRPKLSLELRIKQGLAWFDSTDATGKKLIDGQKYDWVGLLSFSFAKFQGRENNKMFCSEFAVRFLRACGVELFSRDTDADAVSPGMIPYSPAVDPVWLREDKQRG
jgi:hypothetical protein